MNIRPASFLLFFGLFWSALTLLFDFFIFVPAARQLRTTGYASTEGTIISSEVTRNSGEHGPTYGVAVSYRYSVGDHEFTGNRYRHGAASTSDSAWARARVRAWSAGRTVRVFYDRNNPSEAVLQTGLSGSDLFMFAFITPFNGVMLGLCWAAWDQLRRAWFKPVAGGARILPGPRGMRVRLSPFSPLAVGLAGAGISAFLSIFVVAFTAGGFHPSLSTMAVAWSLILGSGVAAGGWQASRVLSGKYDLVLDELSQSLELPLIQGRTVPKIVPFSAIQTVEVETVSRPSARGRQSSVAYVPTLKLREGAEPITEWYNEYKAKEFALWLRDKIAGKAPSTVEEAKEDI